MDTTSAEVQKRIEECRATQATTLDLSNLALTVILPAIGQLQNLQVLSLDNNQLSTLPDAITHLQNLQVLYLANNPLLNPPLEVASRGIEAIRTYFANFGEIDHLYEAKLLLVGEGEVGKTSIKKKLVNSAVPLTGEVSTKGIDIQRWVIPGAELGLAKDFTFNIWDFGGQDIYHHIHQFFLTRRSLYLLLTEARKEDQREDFYWWLNIVRLLGDRSPVILVLNKIDVRIKELPVNQLRAAFPNLVDYQRVSCADGYGSTVEALKEAIRRQLRDRMRMGHVAAPLPAAWVAIRQAIEQLRGAGHAYISNANYLALCAQHKLDETIANVLSDYFHDLGVFLHFRDDLRLNQTIFLDHKWVTDAVYRVLDHPTVIAQYGAFTDRDLMAIWSDATYREKQPELLALMMNDKFEICYQLPNGRGYLAPQRLPEDAPADLLTYWRSDKENLHFEYRYTFMPKGILSRLMVKRHQDIYQAKRPQTVAYAVHWRQGVLLEWGNTRALVREEYFERKLTIVLEGGNKKGFLEIIRKTVEEIHASFNNLPVQEMIPCHCVECRTGQPLHFFRYELLERYRRAGKREITCENSLQEVHVQALINDVFLPEARDEGEFGRRRALHVHGDYVAGDKNSGDRIDATVGENAQDVAIGKGITQG